jgi:NADH:ubiquinone reductase (H+-translocating)
MDRRVSYTSRAAPRVVVIGAGFGGLEAVRGLDAAPVSVTVIDHKNHHLFQPLLYQVATAVLSPADICAPIRVVLRHQCHTEVLMAEVTGVDTANRRVLLGDRSCPYDYLVIATGSGQSYFGHEEWERFAPGLKTTSDATLIRRKILLAFEAAEMEPDPERRRSLLTFVVVGGGPTGVELTGAIAELAHKVLIGDFRHVNPASARVVLVEALGRILPSFPERLARKVHCKLQRLGVRVRTASPVESVDEDGVIIAGERLESKTVIWAAGVKASPAAQWVGAETDKAGRALVGEDLTLPSHPEIFIIGDTAGAKQDGKPLPAVAPVAMQEGRYVAKAIRSRVAGEAPPAAFRYFDKGYLATVGRAYAVASIKRFQFSGLFAWLIWAFVHITYLVTFRNRVLVMIQWAWLYLTSQPGARLIPPDEETKCVEEAMMGR